MIKSGVNALFLIVCNLGHGDDRLIRVRRNNLRPEDRKKKNSRSERENKIY